MIVVRLKGGLGNQMFQYALGRVLSIKNNTGLLLDTTFFNKVFPENALREYALNTFNIDARVANKDETPIIYRNVKNQFLTKVTSFIKKFFRVKGIERDFCFDKNFLELKNNSFLEGYFQSYKYFIGYEDIIKKDFTLKNIPDKKIQDMASEILNSNSLCIHVRRGDYVGNNFHDVVNEVYYEKGIEYITSKTKIDKIYVFSDDIEWCRKNLKFNYPIVFVGQEYCGIKDEGHMYLMSKCKHFIIANSSFSWWGAWLSSNPGKIIVCPTQWFSDKDLDTSDLIPKEWIRI